SAISTIHPAALSFLSVVYMVAGPTLTAPCVDDSMSCMMRYPCTGSKVANRMRKMLSESSPVSYGLRFAITFLPYIHNGYTMLYSRCLQADNTIPHRRPSRETMGGSFGGNDGRSRRKRKTALA